MAVRARLNVGRTRVTDGRHAGGRPGEVRLPEVGISFILAFVGGKMIATATGLHIPIQISLLVIFASLALAIAASLFIDRKQVKQTVPVENN